LLFFPRSYFSFFLCSCILPYFLFI
jgi:hypothetical protein